MEGCGMAVGWSWIRWFAAAPLGSAESPALAL